MAAYRRVYDSHHLQTDCQELGSAPEPYAQQSSMGYLYLYFMCEHVCTYYIIINILKNYNGSKDTDVTLELSMDRRRSIARA